MCLAIGCMDFESTKKQIEEDKEIAEELPNRNQSDAGTTDSDQ